MFEKQFNFIAPTVLPKTLFETNNKKDIAVVDLIKSELKDLKEWITNISEEEKKIEKQDKIIDTVEEIIEFNEKIQKQVGHGLKILIPGQMLSILPITLSQLKAGNNSKKLKNEIR